MSRRSGGLFGLLAGIGIGVGAGMLLAPKSGEELRKDLTKKLNELLDKAKEIDVNEVADDFKKKVKDLKKEIEDLDKEKALSIAKEKGEELKVKATELLDLAKEIQGKAKIIEEMGCPLFDLIQDMSENFFIEYVNFVGITRFLPFFLLEGAKGIYRLVYGILFYCNMLQDVTYVSANSGKGDLLETLAMKITSSTKIVEKKPIEEVIKIFRKNSNKIDNFSILLETATQLKLTHLNNNYITQVLPPSIRDKMPKITNLKYIPNFTPESKIFKKSEIEQLWELIPSDSNFKYSNAILIFDKEKNPECDLSSIYEIGNQMDDNSKILFLIQTTNDEVFGGFMEQNIKLTDKVKYITPPQSLLFSVRPEMKVYFPKETDEIVCFEPGAIRFGYGTDGPAISICFDLQEGQTEKDSVFGKNICLIKDGDEGIFSIKGLEIYLMP
jgi:gas vesicle protein